MHLSSKTHYLQVALNGTYSQALEVLARLPVSERILIEAGTPLLKAYGIEVVGRLKSAWQGRLYARGILTPAYVVADLKCMDRGEREASMAADAGARGVVALGKAPVETLDQFIATCFERSIDPMIDMMNVDKPHQVLRTLKKLPAVVILHRGVDEAALSDKPLPIHLINKVKGAFDVMTAIAGGDTSREVQSAVFNGADIVVVWKQFASPSAETAQLAEDFLSRIK